MSILSVDDGLSSTPIKRGRHRGDHSVQPKNPEPQHSRRASYKKLPGALGRLARIAAKKEIDRSLVFLHAFAFMGRKRDFYPLRRAMINATMRKILDCLDMATRMPTMCWEQMAMELNVTPARMSRLLTEVLMPAGVVEPFDTDAYQPQYNSTHGVWFPSLTVVTDKFFEACGASDNLIRQLRELSAEKLSELVDINTGQSMTLNAAQALRKKWAWDRAYDRRKDAARAQKKRAYLAALGSIDARLSHVGRQLMLEQPERYLGAEHNALVRDAWVVLHRLNVATIPKSTAH